MKPDYCTRPNIPECRFCSLVNYGLDCANNPVLIVADDDHPSKYQQVYDLLYRLTPSEKTPHIDALQAKGLLETLTVEQCADVVMIAQTAYRNGQASRGAEKIDSDAVWVDGVGAIERQPDGSWKLTMSDQPGAVSASVAAAAMGSVKTERKASAARENGKKGGRPKKVKPE